MRAVVQRVERAHVDVVAPTADPAAAPAAALQPDAPAAALQPDAPALDESLRTTRVGELAGPGLVVLVGVGHDDGSAQVTWLADKLAGLRVMRGERSVVDAGAGVLLVSQFTLLGDVRKGRRPTWSAAAPGPVAEPVVDALAAALRDRGVAVPTGSFGADMRVHLVNDGPVTLIIDTP